jgi:hypothetical protein
MAPSFSQFRYFRAVAECGHFGFVSARASKYKPFCAGIVPLRGHQDADRRERTGQDMQVAVTVGNMLVTI